MKYLQTFSVVVLGFPCLLITTFRNFSSSQLSIKSCFLSSSASLVSEYRSFFCAFRSTVGSWLNLHRLPFSQPPFLKKTQSTVLGSTPNGTFWTWTGLKSSAASRLASSAAAFSFSRWSRWVSFFFSSAFLFDWACA